MAWITAIILALGSISSYCEGTLTAYCPNYENCTRDYYGNYSCVEYVSITVDYPTFKNVGSQ